MKKNILLIVVFVLGSVAAAFAAVPVPTYSYTPSTGIDNKVLENIVKANTARVKALKVKTEAMSKAVDGNSAAIGQNTAAVTSMAKNVDGLTTAVENNVKAVTATGIKADQATATVKAEAKSLGDQAYKNAWVIGVLILLVAVVIIAVNRILARRSREVTGQQLEDQLRPVNRRADEVLTAMQTGFAAMTAAASASEERIITAVAEIPVKVAEINELQRPFMLYGIHGHNYCINPVMIDGKVRTLRIPTGIDEDDYDVITKVPRTAATSLTHLKTTNARVLLAVFDPTLKHDHGHAALQKRVVDNGIGAEIEQVA